ncbi:MAG: hypothetical protein JNJ57_20200, partial [Saprospiraceae bacterium]|nr:hypothetical protein [Saprospiraceae bacterium]
TPAEILTCNPVTITDYRKLLMEVEGVRNAWLEPVETSEPTLYFDDNSCQLSCFPPVNKTDPEHPEYQEDPEACRVNLNGLYNVYIEISNPEHLIIEENNEIQKNEFVKKLINEVQDCLSRHRNLGEDFVKIIPLFPQSVELCADIELTDGYEADKVYLQIIRQLQEYFSPTARFYTLQTLLEKGKNIEDIYAGRPYQLAQLVEPCTKDEKDKEDREACSSKETRLLNLLQNSHGFIDTEELEKVERRTEIRLSDLYSVLHDIEGVESVKNLCLVNLPADLDSAWIYPLQSGCIPVLDESSIINLYNKGVKLPYDAPKIREQLTQYNKTRLDNSFLNLEIPYGAAREGLDEYWSIQTELPRVYGVGETGLPDSATLLRKTQAHQLRAFLLFFDQLLANYLQQLSHIRDIYSRAPEKTRKPELKHSFFAKKLDNKSTQELNSLLRFGANPDQPIIEGAVVMAVVNNPALQTILCDIRDTMNDTLVVELACEKSPATEHRIRRLKARGFKSMARRNRVMESARRDFSTGNYSMEVIQDFSGFFFVFCLDSMPELAFVSYEHYNSRSEAHNAANSAAYWASLTDNYRTYRTGSDFDFEIVFRTADYAGFIQNLLENPDAYTYRRNNLLNHLMARFAERFSDYAAIAFGAALKLPQTVSNHCEAVPQVPDLETIIQHKSDFLWNYPDLSRNRGRAFDYRCPSWNTNNISGFEKRVFALAGMTNRQRRNLCNIEVLPKPRLQEVGFVAGTNERVFYSEKPVLSGYAAQKMAAALQEGMKKGDTIKPEKDPKTGLYNYFLEYKGYRFKGEGLYSSLSAVEDKIRDIKNLYIGEFDPTRNLFPTEFKFEQILTGTDLKFPNPELFNDLETATSKEALKSLVNKANQEFEGSRPEIDLHLVDDRNNIIQLGAWTKTASHFQEIPGQWVWSMWPADKQSELQHESLEKATDASIEYLKTKGYLQAVGEAYFWQFTTKNSITWQGAQLFKEKERAQTAWRQAKEWGVKKSAYHLVQSKTQGARIELRNAKSVVLANTNWFNSNKFDAQELVGDMMERFGNSNTKLKFEKLDSAWSFLMFSSDGKPALESYEVYPTETAALSDLQKAYKTAGNVKAYLPSGDAVNLHYIFILKGDDQRFLAQNQPDFSSPNARDKALKKQVSDFKGAIKFLQYKQLQPTYRVDALPAGRQVAISSLISFPSREEARKALADTMIAIFEAKKVKESEWKLQIADGAEKDANQLLKKELEAAAMKVETSSKAVKWRFQNNRAKADGGLEPLWRSEKEFDDEKKLTEEYTAFFDSIKNLPVVSTTNKPVHLAKGNQKIATLATVSRPSAGEITTIKKTMELIASIDKPLSAIIGNWVRPVDVLQPEEIDRAIISNKPYLYQFAKKDQPVAYHPCPVDPCPVKPCPIEVDPCSVDRCEGRSKTLAKGNVRTYNNLNDACEIKDLLFSKNFLFSQFPDFCQSLQKTIQLPTGENGLCKHHFVLYDLRENKNLWVSFSGYDTKELALEALEEQFFDILEIAACRDNYGKNGKIRTYWDFTQYASGCNPNSECVAVVAEELINSYGANENGLIEYLSGKAAAYPVFKYLDRYYFQLTDPSAPTTPLLVGKESFSSHLEALRAFEYLLQLLAYPNNISVTATSGTQNRYRIDIIELLAVSAQTYSNQTQNDGTIISGEDLAWGRDKDDHCVRAERQTPCSTDPNACHYGVEEFLFEAQKPGAIYPVKEGDYYTYYIVKECFITDFEACWYDTPEERDQVMNNPEDWKFQSVNDSSSQSGSPLCPCGEELPDLPYACMLELKESFLRNWDAIQKDILEDAKRRRDGQYKNLCNPLQEKT